MSSDSPRVASYDAMRALASVSVIAIHVLGAGMEARGAGAASIPWIRNTYTFIWFATPSFAFLTGALIWASRGRVSTWAEYWEFLRRRASVVLVPYLFWSAFYILFRYYTPAELRPQMPLGSYLIDVVKLLLLGRASFHLYFIPVVLEFYLVAPLVSRAFKRWPTSSAIVLWAFGAFITLIVTQPQAAWLATPYRMLQYTVWLLPAAAAGAWYGAVRERMAPVLSRIWPILLIAGPTLRYFDRSPMLKTDAWGQRVAEFSSITITLIGLVCALDALARAWPRIVPVSRRLGAVAFGVYLMHPLVVGASGKALELAGLDGLWKSPAFTVLGVAVVAAISFSAVGWMIRYPALAWVFGRPDPTWRWGAGAGKPAEETDAPDATAAGGRA